VDHRRQSREGMPDVMKITGLGDDGKKYVITIVEDVTTVPTPTTTTLTVGPASPTVEGTLLSLAATVTPTAAAGAVAFTDGVAPIASVPVAAGKAFVGISQAALGTHSFRAAFAPADREAYAASSAVAVPHIVTPSVIPPTSVPNTVKIGTATYPLAGTNRKRETGEIIRIMSPVAVSSENMWGTEISVVNGKITAINRREALRSEIGTFVPAGGYLLSGNGAAKDWLDLHSVLGATVELLVSDIIVPPPVAVGAPIMAEYWMEGVGSLGQLYPKCNRAIAAFYQGTDLVSWGGDGWAGLRGWHKPGVNDILVSIGGQGGSVVIDNIDEGFKHIHDTHFPVDGIDFDNEAFALTTAQTIAVCDATSARLGKAPKDFIVQFVPPGGTEDRAIATAKAVQAKGYRVYLGQQLYETSINDQQVMDQTAKAVAALGAPSVLVGIMIGDKYNSWTVANSVSRMKAVKGRWKDIGGAYVWESDRDGTAEVVAGVGTVLGL
jgi:hypothetical protein